jgi:hypothetical protein
MRQVGTKAEAAPKIKSGFLPERSASVSIPALVCRKHFDHSDARSIASAGGIIRSNGPANTATV